jgi:hypothetical protein
MPRKQTTRKTAAKKTTARKKATTSARKKTTKSSKKMTLVNPPDFDTMVREKAYEKYIERGGWHGADIDDWLKAENEVKKEFSLA